LGEGNQATLVSFKPSILACTDSNTKSRTKVLARKLFGSTAGLSPAALSPAVLTREARGISASAFWCRNNSDSYWHPNTTLVFWCHK
jgi:hypothetical protein